MRYFRAKAGESLGTYSLLTQLLKCSTCSFVTLIGQKIFFWPISEELQPGASVASLLEVVFFTHLARTSINFHSGPIKGIWYMVNFYSVLDFCTVVAGGVRS